MKSRESSCPLLVPSLLPFLISGSLSCQVWDRGLSICGHAWSNGHFMCAGEGGRCGVRANCPSHPSSEASISSSIRVSKAASKLAGTVPVFAGTVSILVGTVPVSADTVLVYVDTVPVLLPPYQFLLTLYQFLLVPYRFLPPSHSYQFLLVPYRFVLVSY